MFFRKFFASFPENCSRKKYYIVYTASFLLISFFVFSWFWVSGRSLVWEVDGWEQLLRALAYYRNYLRGIFGCLLREHRLVIPDWDFHIGEGSDILTTLHYYAIGDPMTLLSVFVPENRIHLFYSFSCVLRLYLSGIAFSVMAFGVGERNRCGILAGALSYSFCNWALFEAATFSFFLNPLIYLPLLILGIEKILRRERPFMYISVLAVAAASNFYFYYMIAVCLAVYSIVRVFCLYGKKAGKVIPELLRLFGYFVSGTCIAGVIMLPVLVAMLGDARMGIRGAFPLVLLYPRPYYSQLPAALFSGRSLYEVFIGLSAPTLPACILLFQRKKRDTGLKILLAVCFLILLLPLGGRFMNGMSYAINRWVWAMVLLCSFILTREWEDLFALLPGEKRCLLTGCAVFTAACFLLNYSRTPGAFSMIAFLLASCIVILRQEGKESTIQGQILMCLLVAAGAVNLAFWQYSSEGEGIAKQRVENRKIEEEFFNNETNAVLETAEGDYIRYTGRDLTKNASVTTSLSSTQYYWSNSNPYTSQFRSDMELLEGMIHIIDGYDDRTALITLSGTGYYAADQGDEKGLPYGFEKAGEVNLQQARTERRLEELKKELGTEYLTQEQEDKIRGDSDIITAVYKNKYALPVGYCYNNYISRNQWDHLNAVEKQQVLLRAACVDEAPPGLTQYDVGTADSSVTELPFEVECKGSGISYRDGAFITTDSNMTAVLTFQGLADSETYVEFTGLDFKETRKYDLYFGDESVDPLNLYTETNWKYLEESRKSSMRKSAFFFDGGKKVKIEFTSSSGVEKTLGFLTEKHSLTSFRRDYIVNLGYQRIPDRSVSITFPTAGRYELSDLKIYGVPVKEYRSAIAERHKCVLEEIRLGTDSLLGRISVEEPSLLCLAVPYSRGWKIRVDGKEQKAFPVNGHYIGTLLTEGEHTVAMSYRTPGKYAGMFLTAGGMILFLLLLFKENVRQRRGRAD